MSLKILFMWNKILYFFELIFLLTILPLLYFQGKKLRELEKIIPEMVFENIEKNYPPEYFADDGIHPSDLGYKLLALEITKKVAN